MASLNSKASLLISLLLLTLSLAPSAIVFFAGFSPVRAFSSLAYVTIDSRVPDPPSGYLSASLSTWGYCLYTGTGLSGDQRCTVQSLNVIFSSFANSVNVTIYSDVQTVVDSLPFKAHPIAWTTSLAALSLATIGVVIGLSAIAVKGKNGPAWTALIRIYAVFTSLTFLSITGCLIIVLMTARTYVNAVQGGDAKMGVAYVAIICTAIALSLCAAVLSARVITIGLSKKNRHASRLSMTAPPDNFPDHNSSSAGARASRYIGGTDSHYKDPQHVSSFLSAPSAPGHSAPSPSASELENHAEFPVYASSSSPAPDHQPADATYTTPARYHAARTSKNVYPSASVVATTTASGAATESAFTSSDAYYGNWNAAGYQPNTAQQTYAQAYGHHQAQPSYAPNTYGSQWKQ